MLAKSATNILASSFYKNSIYLLFNSELDTSAIDLSQFSVSVNGVDRNIQTATVDPLFSEWDEIFKNSDSTHTNGAWRNSFLITLNSELSTSDDVSVSYTPNENGSQNLSFIESALGSGADLQFDANGVWQANIVQNPKFGAGVYALINVENGEILNCIVESGLHGRWIRTPEITGFLENGFDTGSGIRPGYFSKYWITRDYAVAEALLIPAKFLNTPLGNAVAGKYSMGGVVDEIFFSLVQNWIVTATNIGSDLGQVLIGNPGNDIMSGGPGNDTLTGGGGYDRFFVESGTDTITDLASGLID